MTTSLATPRPHFFNFLVNPVDAEGNVYVPSTPADVVADQDGVVIEESRLSQWNLSYGGNFKDKFYIGGGLGIKSFEFERSNTFSEFYIYPDEYIDFINEGNFFFPVEGDATSINYVNANQLAESQRINAVGINGTFGAIYRPVEEVTIGLSYQTPTAFAVSEDYGYVLASEVNGIITDDNEPAFNIEGQDGVVESRPLRSEYSLSTPSRIGLGLSYFIQKYGFLTADVEYINHERHRYRSNTLPTSFTEGLKPSGYRRFSRSHQLPGRGGVSVPEAPSQGWVCYPTKSARYTR